MQPTTKRVLITGVYGLIGNLLYQYLTSQPTQYSVTGLDRSKQFSTRIQAQDRVTVPDSSFIQADLADFNAVLDAVQEIDVVVHLAADPDGYNWESVRDNNVVGTYNVFEACRQAKVQRVVFASSLMVNFGYKPEHIYGSILHGKPNKPPAEIPILTHVDPTRPSGIYAASKIWGEALAHTYSFQHSMSCLCVRFGWVVAENRPRPQHSGGDWLSFRDCTRFLQLCIDAPEAVRYDVLYAVSDNRFRYVDLDHARQVLGYVPLEGDLHLKDNEGV